MVYEEAGVQYSFKELREFSKVEYFLQNLKNDKIIKRIIWIKNVEKVNNLFAWWNRSPSWKVFQ